MQPYEECPRFSGCSVNVCPLDPEQDKRNKLKGEPDCGGWVSTRKRIAAKYPGLLPDKGLTTREVAKKVRWEAMPESEREKRRARGRLLAQNRWAKTLTESEKQSQEGQSPTDDLKKASSNGNGNKFPPFLSVPDKD